MTSEEMEQDASNFLSRKPRRPKQAVMAKVCQMINKKMNGAEWSALNEREQRALEKDALRKLADEDDLKPVLSLSEMATPILEDLGFYNLDEYNVSRKAKAQISAMEHIYDMMTEKQKLLYKKELETKKRQYLRFDKEMVAYLYFLNLPSERAVTIDKHLAKRNMTRYDFIEKVIYSLRREGYAITAEWDAEKYRENPIITNFLMAIALNGIPKTWEKENPYWEVKKFTEKTEKKQKSKKQ